MVQQEKQGSMFTGSAGVELKSEKRIEKISMACNGVLTPPPPPPPKKRKINQLKTVKIPTSSWVNF